MASITVPGFSGVVRILAPQRLEDHQATVAEDCDFRTQDLLPLKGLGPSVSSIGAAGEVESIYRYDSSRWLRYSKDANFARTPTEDKQYGRLYITGLDERPIVTDAGIITNPTGASRYIGVPPPWATAQSDGSYKYQLLATPLFDQPGTGTIETITFTSGANSTSPPPAVVACTAAHKLKDGDWVIFDFPGIAGIAYQVTLSGVTDKEKQFKAKGLGVPGTRSAKIYRQDKASANAPKNVIIKWPDHRLETGDSVVFSKSAFDSPFIVTAGTTYQVEYLDAGQFYIRNSTGNYVTSTASDDKTVNNVVAVRTQSSAYPAFNPQASYDASKKSYTVVYNKDTDPAIPRTWTLSEVLSTQVDRSYVFTLVNGYNEEGPPSLPTPVVSVTPGTPVTLDLAWVKSNAATLTQPTNGSYVTKLRIYRTDALGSYRLLRLGGTDSAPLFETAVWTGMGDTHVDSQTDAGLVEPLSTEGYLPPPDDLKGIIALPNGVLAGFRNSNTTGKTVCASVPFLPYAWPLAYRMQTESLIVGLCATASGLAVLTDGNPYLITGNDPASWSAVKLEAQEPCLSKRSIVDMGDFCIYASPNGLIGINGAEVKNLTAGVLTREQWESTYNPSTIIGSFWNGKYIGSYISGSTRKGFVFDPATGNFTDTTFALYALWNDPKTGKLWVLTANGEIREWDAGTLLSFTWRSKLFLIPKPLNFASMQVLLEDYTQPTTVQVYASDAKIPLFQGAGGVSAPKTVTDNAPFRLPSGYMTQAYQIELKGSGRVRAVGIATSTDELKEQP